MLQLECVLMDSRITADRLCWCGCGQRVAKDFAGGHDLICILRIVGRYGTTTEFLEVHGMTRPEG
jgi:hypothetical protein